MATVASKRTQPSQPTEQQVEDLLASVPDEQRRDDARRVQPHAGDHRRAAGDVGSSMVGFGRYHYRYPSRHEGDWPLACFAPRKQHLVVYLTGGFDTVHKETLARLGPHKLGKGCLYLKRLADVDRDALRELIDRSVEARRRGETSDG